jgi:hypothetical protein
MIENWVDFALIVVGGSTAFLCLFDGTRRLCAFGVHRKAVLMTMLAAGICALYGAFAYWKYADLKTTSLNMNQRKSAPTQLPVNWGRGLSPERKELLSLARARHSFMESGNLGSYFDRGGETRTFAPTQEDLTRRERVVAYYSRAEYAARSSLAEALLWLIVGLVAVLFGFAMSFEKLPAHAGPIAEPDAPSAGTQRSS